MIQRSADEITDLLKEVLKAMRREMDQESHEHVSLDPIVQRKEVL
jgi:hypothetical protein